MQRLPGIPNYRLYRKDRDANGGGSCIYVHVNHAAQLKGGFCLPDSLGVTLALDSGDVHLICTVYIDLRVPPVSRTGGWERNCINFHRVTGIMWLYWATSIFQTYAGLLKRFVVRLIPPTKTYKIKRILWIVSHTVASEGTSQMKSQGDGWWTMYFKNQLWTGCSPRTLIWSSR